MGKSRGGTKKPESLIEEEREEERGAGNEKRGKEENGFFACYLLTSLCPRFKGHTYIGFTVNPRRRVRQHNGEIGSGAWRTKRRRPWEMVICIYGFPTNVSALQFEWAWQHPTESLAVRQAAASFKSFSGVANKIKLAYTMLNLPSWQSLNITVNYFSTKYKVHSTSCPSLPDHMKVNLYPMDELPCYIERDGSLSEDVHCSDSGEDLDEVSNGIETEEETQRDSTVQASADFSHCINKPFSEHNEASNAGNAAKATGIDAAFQCSKEYSHCSTETSYAQSSPSKDQRQQMDFLEPLGRTTPSDILSSSSKEESAGDGDVVELNKEDFTETGWRRGKQQFTDLRRWPRKKQFTSAQAAGKNQTPLPNSVVSKEMEVIDLLTPPATCKIMSCTKKRRVLNVHPEIIDLT